MTSILRSPQALQLTLALVKPDAVAHPLILEVRTRPKPLLYALGIASVSAATGPFVKTDNSPVLDGVEAKLDIVDADPKETENLLEN